MESLGKAPAEENGGEERGGLGQRVAVAAVPVSQPCGHREPGVLWFQR